LSNTRKKIAHEAPVDYIGRPLQAPFQPASARFVVLDGLRGIAALVIMEGHLLEPPKNGIFSNGWMAVDFFFLLSGFVLTHAYGDALRNGLGVVDFMRKRFVRLYPLYFIGLLMGTFAFWKGQLRNINPTLLGILLLPDALHDKLFPINGPSWSLWMELVVNIPFAFLMARRGGLRALLSLASLGLFAALLWNAPLFGGAGGCIAKTSVDLERAFVSFPLGVLVYYIMRGRMPNGTPNGWAIVGLLIGALALPYTWGNASWVEGVCILALFPVLVGAGSIARVGTNAGRLFTWLGGISYALYMVHTPIYVALSRMFDKGTTAAVIPTALIALLLAHVLTQHVDPVLRALFTRLLTPAAKTQHAQGAPRPQAQ
jgi:peptidoglycan/LPS O-acetylase OafA/YrhL